MDISKNHKFKARLRQKIHKSSFFLIGLTLFFSSLISVFGVNVLAGSKQTTLTVYDTVSSSLTSLPQNLSDKIDVYYGGSKQTFSQTSVNRNSTYDVFKFQITKFQYVTSSSALKSGSYSVQSEDDNDQKSFNIQVGSATTIKLTGQYPPVSHVAAPLTSNNIQIEVFDTITLNSTPPIPFSDTITIKGPNGSNNKTATVNSIAPGATTIQFSSTFHTVTETINSNVNSLSPTKQISDLLPNTTYTVSSSLSHQAQTVAPAPGGSLVSVDLTSIYGSSSTSTSSLQNTCETSGTFLPWLICPMISGLSSAVNGIYHTLIEPLLNISPIDISPQNAIYQVWSNFRVYGDVILVITLLVMVFGEAIGGGLVSAYTVKKVLPRLLVAAILLNLSIYLVAMAVDVTNIIGKDIGQLIELPFANVKVMINGNSSQSIIGNSFLNTLGPILDGLGAIVGAGAAIFAFVFMPVLLLTILLPVLISFIAILVTLVIRQTLIVLLLFISPLAFALYCLPNTEKYFKQWWSLLMKTLMVYPIVSIIFAMSTVSAITIFEATDSSGGLSKVIASLLAILGAVIPLFLIPFAFKISGGVLGNIYGLADSMGKKAQEKIKGNPNDQDSLQNRLRRRGSSNMATHDLSPRALGARLNPTNYLTRKGRKNLRGKLDRIRLDYQDLYGRQGMGEHAFNRLKDDSDAMADLVKYGSTSEAFNAAHSEYSKTMDDLNGKLGRKEIDAQQYASQKQVADNRLRVRLAAAAGADVVRKNPYLLRRLLMNQTTIKYGVDEYGQAGVDQVRQVMHRISRGNASVEQSLINEFNFTAKNSGRPDLAGIESDGTYNPVKAFNSLPLAQIVQSPPKVIEALGSSIRIALDDTQKQWSQAQSEALKQALAKKFLQLSRSANEFKIMLANQPNGDVRDAINKEIDEFSSTFKDKKEHFNPVTQATTSEWGEILNYSIDGHTVEELSNTGLRSYDQRAQDLQGFQQNPGVQPPNGQPGQP